MAASRRLSKELMGLVKDGDQEDVVLYPVDEENIMHWRAHILGPPDTPFAGIYYELDIRVSSQYPLKPPSVTFVTPVFHPNVSFPTGDICLDLLKDAWSAVFTLQSLCRSIVALLASPAPDSPLNCDCGNLLRAGDIRGYNSLARMYARLHGRSSRPENPLFPHP